MTQWEVSPAAWRKSRYSGEHGGACVEVAPAWRKSSYSADQGGTCVEVAETEQAVAVRDSKDPDGPVLRISPQGWSGLLAAIKAHG